MEVELQKTTFSPWARTASVMSFGAVMIFLTLGGGRWLLPTLAKYIPAALLGFASAALIWGTGSDLMAPDRARRRWYLGLNLLLSVPVIVMVRLWFSDGTSWLVAGASMAFTLAVFWVVVLRGTR